MQSALLSGGPWLAIQRAINAGSDDGSHADDGGAPHGHASARRPSATAAATAVRNHGSSSAGVAQPCERIEWVVTEEPTAELGDEESWSCINPIQTSSSSSSTPTFEMVDLVGMDQNPTLTASIGIPRVSYKAALLSRSSAGIVLVPGGARSRGGRFAPRWRRSPTHAGGVGAASKMGGDVCSVK